jgi:hypothetical protein
MYTVPQNQENPSGAIWLAVWLPGGWVEGCFKGHLEADWPWWSRLWDWQWWWAWAWGIDERWSWSQFLSLALSSKPKVVMAIQKYLKVDLGWPGGPWGGYLGRKVNGHLHDGVSRQCHIHTWTNYMITPSSLRQEARFKTHTCLKE